MPTISEAWAIIRRAESAVGSMSASERTSLLDEHFPQIPAKDLAELVRGIGR